MDNDLIYGFHPVREALRNASRRHVKLTASENGLHRLEQIILETQIKTETVHPKVLDRLLGADAVHQGLLLETKPLPQPRLDQVEKQGVFVVLDQVTDPHNVGAILRSCAAFKVSALITTARHSAAANGVLFKAASGAYEHVPYIKVTNLARAMAELRESCVGLIGLDSEAELAIGDVTLTHPLAIVLGAEGKGLRQLTRESCDVMARLALPGAIVSLNVSNAAAVALYALSSLN